MLVRATASLPDLDTGQEADVDPSDPLWRNRIRTGLVVTVQPEPDATVPLMPPPPDDGPAADLDMVDLATLVYRSTVNDVLHAVDTGRLDAADVLAVEREGKQRSSLIAALTEGEPDAG